MQKNIDYIKIERKARARKTALNVFVYAMLVIWAILVIFPFYWMILTSVKSYAAYNTEFIPKFFTLSPTIQNYIDAFTAVSLGKYFLNTIIFTLSTTALMMVVIIPAAFAFARLNFRGKNLLIFTSEWAIRWVMEDNPQLRLAEFSKND